MNIRLTALLLSVAVIFAGGVYFYSSTINNEASVSTGMPVPGEDNITEIIVEENPAATWSSGASAPAPLPKTFPAPTEVNPVRSRTSNGVKQPDPPAKIAQETAVPSSSDEPPLKLKGIGVNFEDFKFTKEKLQFDRLFMGFGFVIPGSSSSSGQNKSNPQPTYVVPLGTPVRSLVDGIVAAIPTLWSGDYSIQVTADGKMQKWVYETEHIINPKVKVGDRVTAGQIIGEASTFDRGAPAGYGTVEIGILKGGQTPEHVCPFAYLDDSVRDEIFSKMKNLFQTWEDYTGNQALYPDSEIPGCLTTDAIPG